VAVTEAVVSSVLEVGGIRTPLLSAGDPAATEAVVFVHGNPGSSQDWRDLVEAVGPFGRALAWDAPGFGRADKPADFDYTVGGYAAFIDSALSTLGVSRVHLVLHDFGGPWGLRWAIENPDRFASVVLVNTGVLVGYSWHTMAKIWRTPGVGELFMAVTARPLFRLSMKIGNPRGLPSEFVDRMYDDMDTPTRKAVLKLYRASPSSALESLSAGFRALDRPALVVWGAKDPYIPVEQADLQRRSFPSAEVHVLDDSGHWPFIDNPERTRELVVPFLQRVMGAR
jgi:pimeloyl-ACP methyl ester carboxylesterase